MSAERWAARPEILRPVSEWAGRELMVALSISAEAADALLTRSLTLVDRLPGTLAALEAGALHPGHLWTMLEKVAPIADARIRAEVEAELLRWSAGRVVSPAQLAAKARREVARRDARSAAGRLQKALKERGVHLRPRSDDGMATVTVTVIATMPEAQALYRVLCECAKTLDDDGDARTRGQKLVDCLLDLVLRPGETDLPPVQVLLTVVASIATLAGGDDPGEVDGQVVPAEMIRQLLAALTAAQQPDADAMPDAMPGADAMRDAAATRQRSADDVPWQDAEQDELSRWWAEMKRRVLSGELVDPDPWPEDLPPDSASGFSSCDWPPEWTLEDAALASAAGNGDPYSTYPVDTSRHLDPSAEPIPLEGPPVPALSDQSSGDTSWWAAADRAVDDAGRALFEAGQKVAHAQRLVRTAASADSDDENAWQSGSAGRVNAADDALGALRSTTDTRRQQIADLLATTGGGGLADGRGSR